jgi:hypothetical protein
MKARLLTFVACVSAVASCSSNDPSTAGASQSGSTGASDGSSGASDDTSSTSDVSASSGPAVTTGEDVRPPIELLALQTAQTHVLPDSGLSWSLSDGAHELHLVGRRSFLALVDLGDISPDNPVLEVLQGGAIVGTVPLASPTELPPTEASGPALATHLYSATVDAAWVVPGLSLRVSADNFAPSEARELVVGADSELDMWTLPFYLFGADDRNAPPIAVTAKPDAASTTELYQKWAIGKVNFLQHPAGRVAWPAIVVGPREGKPAMQVHNADEQQDGFAVMSAVLSTLSALRSANGEASTNNQYYAPLLMLDAQGSYAAPGGGLGGGSCGTGDYDYAGIFIHEQGHAFGMPHAGGAYDDGNYPYPGGSLLGSVWGFDAARNEFLAPFIPPTADTADTCLDDVTRQKDGEGRCVKQDPMQSGSGDQDPSYKYTLFSDFNASVIQRYFEGETTLGDGGVHEYDGGTLFVDPGSSTGYSRWDSIDHERVEVPVETTDKGLYGFDRGLPTQRGVPVHAIVFTLSHADTPSVSQIYAPLSYTGNLIRQVDPTSPPQLAEILPNTGDVPWYCHASGCDYTLRVTYKDGTQAHVLLRGGFRPWFDPMGEPGPTTSDPLDSDSFRVFSVNVPGDQPLTKIEVLDTPMGWNGLPADATVLLSRPV